MPILLALLAALAQPIPAPAAPPAAVIPAETVRVTLVTSEGRITLALDKTRAPITTANFLRYIDSKKLDGIAFYRAVPAGENRGFVQFGTRNDPKRTLPPIVHEPTTVTGLSHTDGAISMAMTEPGTAAGDFFIILGDLSSMDATADRPGFAVFGRIVEGMDVIRHILTLPTSPTEGEGVMKGQMLEPTVAIVTARRAN